jgi:hypothetical protein
MKSVLCAGQASTLGEHPADKTTDKAAASSENQNEETEVARLIRFPPHCVHCGAELLEDPAHCDFCGAAT